ncbi:hypothetical protein LINPERHAP1_LOCUS22268 [Linum perenne]
MLDYSSRAHMSSHMYRAGG